jgi:hypothetical protein
MRTTERLQRASLKQDTVVGRTRARMRTLPKQPPANREVQQALADLKGSVEFLHRAAMATGLTTRFPHNFKSDVCAAIKELADIALCED